MFRTAGFYLYFFIRGFFSFWGRWKANRVQLNTVEETDWEKCKVPRQWARSLVNIVGGKITVNGTENLPKGPVVFVSNHQGNFDIPVLIGFIPKPFGFISKMEVMKIPVVGSWMKIMNCVFMDRSSRAKSTQAITAGVEILKKGHSLVIFPEGTRSKGGPVQAFKAGSVRLAIDAEVPIVPIAINGTANIMEKNKYIMKPAEVTVTILPPIPAEKVKSSDSKTLAEELKSLIEAKVKK
ncbi:MAG TPA: lysophospholipid acyltransferase family protein [Leptospiraceae bacterium]|nr:lysophospholipid acyltransferase family protein [Leptospiraceae bacterium]